MSFDPTKIHILCCHTRPGVIADHFTPNSLTTATESLQRAVNQLRPGVIIRDYNGDLLNFIGYIIEMRGWPPQLFKVYYDDQVATFNTEGVLTNWAYGYFQPNFREIGFPRHQWVDVALNPLAVKGSK